MIPGEKKFDKAVPFSLYAFDTELNDPVTLDIGPGSIFGHAAVVRKCMLTSTDYTGNIKQVSIALSWEALQLLKRNFVITGAGKS